MAGTKLSFKVDLRKTDISALASSILNQVQTQYSMKAYRAVINAQNKLRDRVKEGYLNSRSYNIKQVSQDWAARRSLDGGPGDRRALFNTGALMNGVVTDPPKRTGTGKDVGYRFSVRMSDAMHPDAGMPKSALAAIHEASGKFLGDKVVGGRPLWERVEKRHLDKIIDEMVKEIF